MTTEMKLFKTMKPGDLVRIKSGMFKGKLGKLRSRLSYYNKEDPNDWGAWTAFVDGAVEMLYDREIALIPKLKRRKTDG